jgi:hypothetical protein
LRLTRPLVAILGVAAASPGAQAAAPAGPSDYSIAAVEYAIAPFDQVGKLRAGILCLPKGKLRWRDVARPEEDVLARRLGDALRAEAMTVAPPPDRLFGDAEPMTKFRVRVVIERLAIRLCVPGLGIGEKSPSGEGTLTVRWETWDRGGRGRGRGGGGEGSAREGSALVRVEVPVAIERRDARTASSIVSDAVVESAIRYAAGRRLD